MEFLPDKFELEFVEAVSSQSDEDKEPSERLPEFLELRSVFDFSLRSILEGRFESDLWPYLFISSYLIKLLMAS